MRHDFLHHLLHFFWTSQNSQAQAYNFIKKETGVSNKMHLGKNYQDFLKWKGGGVGEGEGEARLILGDSPIIT